MLLYVTVNVNCYATDRREAPTPNQLARAASLTYWILRYVVADDTRPASLADDTRPTSLADDTLPASLADDTRQTHSSYL